MRKKWETFELSVFKDGFFAVIGNAFVMRICSFAVYWKTPWLCLRFRLSSTLFITFLTYDYYVPKQALATLSLRIVASVSVLKPVYFLFLMANWSKSSWIIDLIDVLVPRTFVFMSG